MTTIAIIGAGQGLGAAIALISRNQERLDSLAADLTRDGLTAHHRPSPQEEPL